MKNTTKCEKPVETYGTIGWCTMPQGHDGDCYDDNAEPKGVE